jgi:hypothetical protein
MPTSASEAAGFGRRTNQFSRRAAPRRTNLSGRQRMLAGVNYGMSLVKARAKFMASGRVPYNLNARPDHPALVRKIVTAAVASSAETARATELGEYFEGPAAETLLARVEGELTQWLDQTRGEDPQPTHVIIENAQGDKPAVKRDLMTHAIIRAFELAVEMREGAAANQ